MDSLLQLAERCEAAEGPDRELDLAIYETVTIASGHEVRRDQRGFRVQKRGEDTFFTVKPDWVLAYTASLDAAMTLIPEGWAEYRIALFIEDAVKVCLMNTIGRDAFLARLPAFIAAAALRARHSQGVSDNG